MTALQEVEALTSPFDVDTARDHAPQRQVGARRAARDGRGPRGRSHPHVRRGLARPAAPDPPDGDGRGGEVLQLPDGPVVQPDPRRRAAVPWPHLAAAAQRRGRHRDPRRRPALGLDGHGADRHPRGPRARHHRARRRELPLAVPRADHLRAQRQQAHRRHVGAQRRPSNRSPPASGTTRTCSARCRRSARPPRRPRVSRSSRSPRRRATRWSTPSRRARPARSRSAPTSASPAR